MKKILAILLPVLLALSAGAANAARTITAFGPDTLAKIEAGRKGRPFVLVIWSHECVYCKATLETLAREKKKRPDLDIVTIATDPHGEPQIRKLLDAKLSAARLKAESWAFGSAPPEQLRYAIDPKWHGELPRTYVYQPNGERVGYSGVLSTAALPVRDGK